MSTRKVIFVGGPLDGQIMQIPESQTRFLAREEPPARVEMTPSPFPFRGEDVFYNLEPIKSQTSEYWVMLVESMNTDDLIQRLLSSYAESSYRSQKQRI